HLCRPLFSEAVKRVRYIVCGVAFATIVVLAALVLLAFGSSASEMSGAIAGFMMLIAAAALVAISSIFFAWLFYRICKHVTRKASRCCKEGLPRPYPRIFTGIAWRVCARVHRLRQNIPDSITDSALSPIKKAGHLTTQWLTHIARNMAKPYYTRIKRQCLIDAASLGDPDVIHCHDLWALPVGA